MGQEFRGGRGWNEHVAVLIPRILATVVAAPGSVVMVQLDHSSRSLKLCSDRGPQPLVRARGSGFAGRQDGPGGSFRHDEPSFADKERDGLAWHPHQTVIADAIAHYAVIGLVLAEHRAERYNSPSKGSPRVGPGGLTDTSRASPERSGITISH